MYKESVVSENSPDLVTLDQILRGQGLPMPKRRQRFALAFVLASSFLQLLESPWLPTSWKKSDIVFFQSDDAPSGKFLLDQPHLNRNRHHPREGHLRGIATENERRKRLADALDLLGIVLLELCFGQLLEDQSYRSKYPHLQGMDEDIKAVLDVAAAKEWHGEIEEEAGYDYAQAVGWCFGGILQTSPDQWRKEMLTKVVRPLESCHSHLSKRNP